MTKYKLFLVAVMSLVLNGCADVDQDTEQTADIGVTVLIQNGDLEGVKSLGNEDINVDSVDQDGNTHLITAVVEGQDSIVVELLERGLDVKINATNNRGNTALIEAVKANDVELVKILVSVPGVDVTIENEDGDTAITIAEREGFTDVLNELVKISKTKNQDTTIIEEPEAPADSVVSPTDSIADCVWIWCRHWIKPDTTKTDTTIVEPDTTKADTTIVEPDTTKVDTTVVQPDTAKTDTTVVEPDDTTTDTTTVQTDTAKADTTKVVVEPEPGMDVQKEEVTAEQVEIVDVSQETLEEVKEGTDTVTVQDKKDQGTTTVDLMQDESEDTTSQVVESKPDTVSIVVVDTVAIDREPGQDTTGALVEPEPGDAVEHTETPQVQRINGIQLEEPSDASAVTVVKPKTPARSNEVETVKVEDEYAFPNVQDIYGKTPLIKAVENNDESAVEQLLLSRVTNPNLKDVRGESALTLAAKANFFNTNIWNQLVAREDINLNIQNNKGETPLLIATSLGRHYAVRSLLGRKDIDVNLPDDRGRTPLIAAAENGTMSILELLVSRPDTEVNSTLTIQKETALMHAVRQGYIPATEILLSREDIDTKIRNYLGMSASDFAARSNNKKMMQVLHDHELRQRQEEDTN